MSRKQEMQRVIRAYIDETGESEVDMHKVAEYAQGLGWPLPQPPSAIDILARQFTDAARETVRHDSQTKKPYRAYHALPVQTRQGNLFVYIDIDNAPREKMLKSLVKRREQMVDDGLQLTFDLEHWNRVNPTEKPIELPMDLTLDIEWRKNTPDEEDEAA